MSAVASTVLDGDAAFLVAAQADLMGSAGHCEIYRLRTADLRLGMYDAGSRRLVIIDGAALAALAMVEAAEDADPPPAAPRSSLPHLSIVPDESI